jgi:CRP/FNR family transcriptional regulator
MLEKPTWIERIPAYARHSDCAECDTRAFCLIGGLERKDTDGPCAIFDAEGPFCAGERIYRAGEAVRSVYAIRKGTVKLETVTQDGRLLVNGLLFTGELLGVDGIGTGAYPADAVALEETYLCGLRLAELDALCRKVPEIQTSLLGRLSSALSAARYGCAALRQQSAAMRTLAFLRQLQARQQVTGAGRAGRICLPMTKQDIASYLWMSPESLSRSLKNLEEEGYIRNTREGITLV